MSCIKDGTLANEIYAIITFLVILITRLIHNFCFIEGIRMYYTADDECCTVSGLGCDGT